MRIHGAQVRDDDARRLVASLFGTGRPDAIGVARKIVLGIERRRDVRDLTPSERSSLLRMLVDPPDALLGLRAALARDFARRAALPNGSPRSLALCAGIAASLRALLAR